jgi:hypothetical protein
VIAHGALSHVADKATDKHTEVACRLVPSSAPFSASLNGRHGGYNDASLSKVYQITGLISSGRITLLLLCRFCIAWQKMRGRWDGMSSGSGDEIWRRCLFGFFDAIALMRVSTVCKEWKRSFSAPHFRFIELESAQLAAMPPSVTSQWQVCKDVEVLQVHKAPSAASRAGRGSTPSFIADVLVLLRFQSRQIKKLEIEGLALDFSATELLVAMIEAQVQLHTLSLPHNRIGTRVVEMVHSNSKSWSLTALDLSNTCLGSSGAMQLTSLFPSMPSLCKLNLLGNDRCNATNGVGLSQARQLIGAFHKRPLFVASAGSHVAGVRSPARSPKRGQKNNSSNTSTRHQTLCWIEEQATELALSYRDLRYRLGPADCILLGFEVPLTSTIVVVSLAEHHVATAEAGRALGRMVRGIDAHTTYYTLHAILT